MTKKTKTPGTLMRVLKYLRGSTATLGVSLLFTVVSVLLTLYTPILIGDAIDLIVGEGNVDFHGITEKLTLVGFMIAVSAVAQWVVGVLNNRMTYRVVCRIRREAFDRIQRLPLSYLDRRETGALVSRMISDVDTFSDGLLMGLTQLFSGVVTILGTLVLMLLIDWRIALIVIVLTPASIIVSKFIAGRTFRLFREQAQAREEQTAFAEEMIAGEKTVKAFRMENYAEEHFEEANEKLRRVSVSATFYSSLVNPSTRFVNGIVYAAVALAGSISAIGGGITVGGVTCFLGYANQYTKPFNEISGVITEFQNALACASRIFELLDAPIEEEPAEPATLPKPVAGQVDIEGVDFSYDPEKSFIKDMTFHIKPGQKVAIVGPTGCGKTTVINLLMRFYDVTGGKLCLDGVDIRDVDRGELRRGYGMVLQDTWLKNGTVAENIALGRPEATREEIVSAAKSVHAHSFIKRLQDGYDTVIGEGDGVLSQGERQLISIARVMLCLPPVLILDEATSSIDIMTESRIQRAFDKLTEGRTSIIVAHRLTTVRNADVILVMRDGRIVESGRHEELLGSGGEYKKLYESQFIHEERN